MGGLGWAELLVIGVVALVVIGPKDLPEMFRQLGRFTARARAMAGEFSRAMEQAAKDSGAADVAKDLKNVTSAKSMGLDKVRAAVDGFEKWQPLAKDTAKDAAKDAPKAQPLTPPPMPPAQTPAPVVADHATEVPDKPAPKPRKAAAAKTSAEKPAPKAKT